MVEYIEVKTAEEYKAAAKLFAEYAAWLAVDLGFQHFDEELQNLQKVYTAANGGIILCKSDNEFVGSVAIKRISAEIAELKRMYVQPAQQHKGIGQQLLLEAVVLAEKCAYQYIRLDTLNHMLPAINLYTKNGFYPIPAYYYNPIETAVYFEKKL
ncbi:MAG: GNAT family N-acetyltransferase [Ferruginibacter sp.]